MRWKTSIVYVSTANSRGVTSFNWAVPERYLRDENGLPLKAWRDGAAMVAESPAPGGWQHRWQGLDPRR